MNIGKCSLENGVLTLEVYDDNSPFPTIICQEVSKEEVTNMTEFKEIIDKTINKANGAQKLITVMEVIDKYFSYIAYGSALIFTGGIAVNRLLQNVTNPSELKQKIMKHLALVTAIAFGTSIVTLFISSTACCIASISKSIAESRDVKAINRALGLVKHMLSKAKNEKDKNYLEDAKYKLENALDKASSFDDDDYQDKRVNRILNGNNVEESTIAICMEATEVTSMEEFRNAVERVAQKANGAQRLIKVMEVLSNFFGILAVGSFVTGGAAAATGFGMIAKDMISGTKDYNNWKERINQIIIWGVGISALGLIVSNITGCYAAMARVVARTEDADMIRKALNATENALKKAKNAKDIYHLEDIKERLQNALNEAMAKDDTN